MVYWGNVKTFLWFIESMTKPLTLWFMGSIKRLKQNISTRFSFFSEIF